MRLIPAGRSISTEMSERADQSSANGSIQDPLCAHGSSPENSTRAKDCNRLYNKARKRPVAAAEDMPAYPAKRLGMIGDAVPR
jgi:hypothetical protein